MLINANFGRRDLGVNSIIENTYSPYISYFSTPFPSGDFRKILFLNLGIQWWYKPYLSFIIKFDQEKIAKHGSQSTFECGLDIFFPVKTKI